VWQTDVIKYILQRPILSGRIGKWAYVLVEYDLAYESIKSMKGQILADFIVQHRVCEESDQVISDQVVSNQVVSTLNLVSLVRWRLYFDGSVCSNGQGLGVVYISPTGTIF
jgi:hypothetical protein